MEKLKLRDLSLKRGDKVLMRVDFNVPLDAEGKISDDTRIRAALKSINYILQKGCSLVLMSHLGRPKGEVDKKLTLRPCALRLFELLEKRVIMAPDCIGELINRMKEELKEEEVLLLENLRFHEAEEKPIKDPTFAEKLAVGCDFYVNDAFGTAHRKHSSTYEITKFFPGRAAMGFLIETEINALDACIKDPARPFYAILAGAKISTKLGIIKSLLTKVDKIFIGGAMAFTFFKAKGIEIGASLFEEDQLENARELLKEKNKIALPEDIVIAGAFKEDAPSKTIRIEEGVEPASWQGMDVGSSTIEKWFSLLKDGRTIFWNGPLGVYEFENFSEGTNKLALFLAELPAKVIVGGGDSLSAIKKLDIEDKFYHLSTGGGASLEYIEMGTLPGIEALSPK